MEPTAGVRTASRADALHMINTRDVSARIEDEICNEHRIELIGSALVGRSFDCLKDD